ncbi:ImmA/IrrE family metallo-endopeptidase [Leucobacter sp. cx-169]|uniref:ImmA/IrrE family metallo-endopeptidase n=1 Tax=Leucobacter sp. cx-169 TaxID=2770549 RepID=UPI00165E733E|nr:ImmA/IrrE family metallo-endopeptidase [Leucobacter sp. cx-169]MBC9927309.1 ImmA/IrrE family metallo-endopeptidase [Leucobacter sp. cx-169]
MNTSLRHTAGTVTASEKVGGRFRSQERDTASAPPIPESDGPLDRYFDSVEEKVAAMSAELETLVKNLETDEGWNNYLSAMEKFHNYSFANQMLIAMQKPDATRVAGKGAWAALGRTLKPVEERGRGISIFRPKMGRADAKDQDGNPRLGPDGKPLKEMRVFGYTTTTVYDISQTEGSELPVGVPHLTEEPPAGFIEDLEAAITERGYPVSYEDIPGSKRGYTSINRLTGERRVVVSSNLPVGDRAHVLAHELGHIAAGHMDETDDYHTGEGGRRGVMEVEAESISHVLTRMNGMQTPGEATAPYVAGWANVQGGDSTVKDAGVRVQKAIKEIVIGRVWANVDGSGPKAEYVRKPRAKKGSKK